MTRRSEHWKRWLLLSRTSTLVAEKAGTIRGFCTLHPSPLSEGEAPGGEIAALFVLPSSWRGGIGGLLCNEILAGAWDRGFSHVELWVLESNDRARAFYDSVGFKASGAKRVFSEGSQEELDELRYRIEAPGIE